MSVEKSGRERLGWRGDRIGLKERVEIGGCRGASKGKHIFVNNNMTRDEYAVGSEVETAIPLMVRGVCEEEAASGARGQLMRSDSRSVEIAGTAEHVKVVVKGGCVVQGKVGGWCGSPPLRGGG